MGLGQQAGDGAAVLVATRQLAVGDLVTSGDVEVRHVSPDVVPVGALTLADDAVGLPAATVLSPGEVLTGHDVRTGSLLAGRPGDELAVWLPVPDSAVADALSGGDRVDVLSPVDGALVVGAVEVLAARHAGAVGGSGLLGSASAASTSGASGPSGVWLAVSPEQSAALAAARGADPAGAGLLLALHRPG